MKLLGIYQNFFFVPESAIKQEQPVILLVKHCVSLQTGRTRVLFVLFKFYNVCCNVTEPVWAQTCLWSVTFNTPDKQFGAFCFTELSKEKYTLTF